MANSFLSTFEKSHSCRFRIIKGDFSLFILKNVLYVLIELALSRTYSDDSKGARAIEVLLYSTHALQYETVVGISFL